MKCTICGQPAANRCGFPQRTGAIRDVQPSCKVALCRRHFIVQAQGTRHHNGQAGIKYCIGYCPDHHAQMKQRDEPIPRPLATDED